MSTSQSPLPTDSAKKPIYKRIWFWVVVIIVLAGVGSQMGGGSDKSAEPKPSATVVQATDAAQEVVTTPAPGPTTPAAEPTPEAPQVSPEYASALEKAYTYAEIMNMSKAGIYDQLVSEYGEKFTPEAAQYAIDTIEFDWSANALAKAKLYQNEMAMSPAAIHDQLVSQYGEKFTEEEATYAIEHLND